MKKLLLTLLLAVVSSSVMAEWVYYTESIDTKFYIKTDSVRKSGNTVRMWFMSDLQKFRKTVTGKKYLSFIDKFEFKCEEEQKRSVFQIFYSENMGKGSQVESTNYRDEWSPVVPYSLGESLWEFACGK